MKLQPAVILLALVLTTGGVNAVAAQHFEVLVPGILTRSPANGCDVLHSLMTGEHHVLDNIGGFVLGDTVVVTAASYGECICDTHLYSYLHDNTIGFWRGYDFGCGQILMDPEYGCATVESDRFGPLLVGWSGGFGTGDLVRAIGTVQLSPCLAIPECFAYYCLWDVTLLACSDTSTAVQSLSWSRLKARFR